MRAAALAREVGKRHLGDTAAVRIGLHQDLLQYFEVVSRQLQLIQCFVAVQTKSARKIAHPHGEQAPHRTVEHAAQELAEKRCIGHAAMHVPRSNDDVGLRTSPPQFRDKVRLVREVSVERQHVITSSFGKAGLEGPGIPSPVLADNACAEVARHLGSPVLSSGRAPR